MKFKYLKQRNPANPAQPWVLRPYIPIRLFYGQRSVSVLALVDSGADESVFHASIGRLLGIDVPKGRKKRFVGISGTGADGYVHRVRLQVVGVRDSIELDVGFLDVPGVDAILGQAGFFEYHRVVFERAKEQIEIRPLRKKWKIFVA
jgi:hypothetical protein